MLKTEEKKINLYFSNCSVGFDYEDINFRDPHPPVYNRSWPIFHNCWPETRPAPDQVLPYVGGYFGFESGGGFVLTPI